MSPRSLKQWRPEISKRWGRHSIPVRSKSMRYSRRPGASLLTVAAFCDQPETVKFLLEKGADANQKNGDSGTPLHVAVFMGRVESAMLLLDAGADPETRDGNGKSSKDNLKVDFGTTRFIAGMYGQELDEAELTANRAEIARLLGEGQEETRKALAEGPGLEALYGLFFQIPIYMHLWFLAFLCWMVIAFVIYAPIAKRIRFERIPKWLLCSPIALLWLVPMTMLPQWFMMPGVFGPDTSVGLLPIPSVLGYYAIFFFFGAIYWDLDDNDGLLGPLVVRVAAGGSGSFYIRSPWMWSAMRSVLYQKDFAGISRALLGNFLQALFAWLMIFGSIGMFRALLSKESKTTRYISDSSYWLYLMHLPLVILAQWYRQRLAGSSFDQIHRDHSRGVSVFCC